MIPINKQSKKNQKKYHQIKRITWGVCNPVTRTHKSIKPRDQRNKDKGNYESTSED